MGESGKGLANQKNMKRKSMSTHDKSILFKAFWLFKLKKQLELHDYSFYLN